MSHIQLNYASLLFWSIFVGSHWELFFLDIIVTITEMSAEILRKFVFLTMFEKWQILRKIRICLNKYFWPNQLKEIYINKNCFAPQSEPHNATLCLSVVLKNFWGNSSRTFLFRHKGEHWNTQNTQNVCFSYLVWKGQTLRKIWICLNNCFWLNQ